MFEFALLLYPVAQILIGMGFIIFARQILKWADHLEEKIAGKMDRILSKPFFLSASRSSAAHIQASGYFIILIWLFRILGMLAVTSGIYYIVTVISAFNS